MASAPEGRAEPNRWAVLALLSIAQLMVVLDATIINIALPSAQKDLGFSTDSRQWVVTAYALAFGSLLLLGGKLGDLFGRKWTFIAGLAGFSLASAIGGLAQSFAMLVAARALQGAFGALLAPSALSLLTVTFADSPDRPKAFGIFGAIAGGGASIGLILGGALTQAFSWRACLYVNLVIAIPTAIIALRLLINHSSLDRPKIDLPGVLTGSGGLFALVYGFSSAETNSWTATITIVALVASVALLISFVLVEQRAAHPLLPLHIVCDRARGGAYASIALAGAGIFAVFLFLTYFMQDNLGLSPLLTGVAFMPMTALIVISSTTSQTKLLPRTGAKPLIVCGMVLGLVSMLLLTRLKPSSSYAADLLPSLLILGLGMGLIFAPAFGTATLGVPSNEAGVASAMVNTSQQVGGSVGTSLLSTLFASSAAAFAKSHIGTPNLAAASQVHGYTTAFWWASGIFAVGLIVAATVFPARIKPAAAADPAGSPGDASLATD
jgi:EmrB/QacA subfamily drug resistance transporter